MRVILNDPPRTFMVGNAGPTIAMKDCGKIRLQADEQVTLITEHEGEYDVARKEWGFYATPSLNARLAEFALHAALVRNPKDRYFILLCEEGKEQSWFHGLRCRS